jgi:hypothetical protein
VNTNPAYGRWVYKINFDSTRLIYRGNNNAAQKKFEFRKNYITVMTVLLVACGGGGGSSSPTVNPSVSNGTAVVTSMVGLVEVSSMQKGKISASWLPASDDAATAAGITYELHLASGVEDFTPGSNTLKFSGKALSTIVDGLTIGSV